MVAASLTFRLCQILLPEKVLVQSWSRQTGALPNILGLGTLELTPESAFQALPMHMLYKYF